MEKLKGSVNRGEVKVNKKLKRKKLWSEVLRDYQLYLMLVPFVLIYLIFNYFPMYGLQMAFQDYKPYLGFTGSKWVGFKHFINFFTGPYAWRVIRNTFMINVYDLAFNFTLTIVMALLLNEIAHKKIRAAVQTVIYVPYFISTVVVAGLVISLLSPTSGIINLIIEKLGGERVSFLSVPAYFKPIFVIMNGWSGIGFGTILYTSAICGIDESLYEAAEIDGAGRFAKIWHVTLPGISTTIVIMFILRMGQMLSVGSDAILLLYQPITYETADVISTFVYRYGIEQGDYSFSSAVGLFNGIVALILVVTANKISQKVSETSLW